MNTQNPIQRAYRAERPYLKKSHLEKTHLKSAYGAATVSNGAGYLKNQYAAEGNACLSRERLERRERAMKKRERIQRLRRERRRKALTVLSVSAAAAAMVLICFLSYGSIRTNANTGFKYYTSITVEPGDSLWELAGEYMDGEHYADRNSFISEVRHINRLDDENGIVTGQTLIIPYYSSEYIR